MLQTLLQAFAALSSDGSVTTWGNSSYGGNSSSVSSKLSSGVTKVSGTNYAFAALKMMALLLLGVMLNQEETVLLFQKS